MKVKKIISGLFATLLLLSACLIGASAEEVDAFTTDTDISFAEFAEEDISPYSDLCVVCGSRYAAATWWKTIMYRNCVYSLGHDDEMRVQYYCSSRCTGCGDCRASVETIARADYCSKRGLYYNWIDY